MGDEGKILYENSFFFTGTGDLIVIEELNSIKSFFLIIGNYTLYKDT